MEKKFSFLEQYYNNEIEIFIDEWGFYKENVEYSIWLSDSDFISILVKNEKVEIVFEKKDCLIALDFLNTIKTVDIFDEKQNKIYDILVNNEKTIEYRDDSAIESIEKILIYIEKKKNKIKIETRLDKDENNCITWIESKNYESRYLEWKSYKGKSTTLTAEEKKQEYDKLTDKEKILLKLEQDMLLDAFHLSQEHTRNFFGEEFLKNNIKNAKKKIDELKNV